MTIRESMNYDRFKFLPGINRMIKSNHVTRMKRSILMMGVMRPVIIARISFIDGILRDYVLDGQHLIMALRALRLPVPYVYVDVANMSDLIKTVAKLNSTAVRWALKDYVHAWKALKTEYVDLERYHLLYSMSYQAIGMIALNSDRRRGISDTIKDGSFRITNSNFLTLCEEAFALLAVENLNDLMRVPDRFVAGLVRYYNDVPTYSRDHIAENIRNNIDLIRAAASDTIDKVLRERIFV